MKRIITILFLCVATLITPAYAYTAQEVYNSMENAFLWVSENASPLGGGDSVASDYYVMALSRGNRSFDYNKYKKITLSRVPETSRDAHRIIMANAASDGYFNETFVADYTYRGKNDSISLLASSILALASCDYEVKDKDVTLDEMVVKLLSYQSPEGSFGGDVYKTAEAILALSHFEGNRYALVGEYKTEKYYYDVNTQILRGVNYLQGAKDSECGYGSIKNTAMVIMALDSVGIDAHKDAGFVRDGKSVLGNLLGKQTEDGKFSDVADENALAVCAVVSHVRAMEGKEDFYKLRGYDKIVKPSVYTDDINLSGNGFLDDGEGRQVIEIKLKDLEAPSEAPTKEPLINEEIEEEIDRFDTEDEDTETDKKILPMLIIIFAIIIIAGAICIFVLWRVGMLKRLTRKK